MGECYGLLDDGSGRTNRITVKDPSDIEPKLNLAGDEGKITAELLSNALN